VGQADGRHHNHAVLNQFLSLGGGVLIQLGNVEILVDLVVIAVGFRFFDCLDFCIDGVKYNSLLLNQMLNCQPQSPFTQKTKKH
jgi:hypothetical protein